MIIISINGESRSYRLNEVLIIWHEHHVCIYIYIYISCSICYSPVHLKKWNIVKNFTFCNLFQKVKLLYILDSLHVKYFKSVLFVGIYFGG